MNKRHFPWVPVVLVGGFLATIGVARAAYAPVEWVVNASGGGDFFDIQPAIDAAADGDRIVIEAGFYSDFVLDKSLTLRGQGLVKGFRATVRDASGPAVLADMELRSLEIFDCDAAVVADGLLVGNYFGVTTPDGRFQVNVEDCADVRFISVNGKANGSPVSDGAMRVVNSRVEVTSSSIEGGNGSNASCFTGSYAYGGYGGKGLLMDGDSRVHTTETLVSGGDGGDVTSLGFCYIGYAGAPASGATVFDGDLIVAGGTYIGGDGGKSPGSGFYGPDCASGANGVWGSGSATLRDSGATFIRGAAGLPKCKSGKAVSVSKRTKAKPADPTLERVGNPVVAPGASVTLLVNGRPGAFTRLFLGTQPQVQPKANTLLELLLVKESTVSLGFLPASGLATHQLDLDPSTGYAPGMTIYAQAVCNYPGEQRRTNSVPLVLR